MRDLSDSLCRKYRLSVIENPQLKGSHYSQWNAEKKHELGEISLKKMLILQLLIQ